MRAGIVGAGITALAHAQAITRNGGRVVALLAATPEKTNAAQSRLGAESTCGSLKELLARDDIDVVHLCTPNRLHAEQSLQVLASRKHVVCEKPLSIRANDSEELVRAAAAASVVNTVPMAYRYYAGVSVARDALRGHGAVHLVVGSYLQAWLADPHSVDWRLDVDRNGPSRVFGDIGVHWFDLMEFLIGQRVRRLTAATAIVFPTRTPPNGPPVAVHNEDDAVIAFETDRGALGTVSVSQVAPGHDNSLKIDLIGSSGSQSLHLGGHDPSAHQRAFDAYVADVYAHINGAPRPDLPTFRDGHRSVQLVAAVLAAAQDQTWVEVPP